MTKEDWASARLHSRRTWNNNATIMNVKVGASYCERSTKDDSVERYKLPISRKRDSFARHADDTLFRVPADSGLTAHPVSVHQQRHLDKEGQSCPLLATRWCILYSEITIKYTSRPHFVPGYAPRVPEHPLAGAPRRVYHVHNR